MSGELSFPYEREAMHGDEMPDGLTLYDQAAFQALRCLYKSYYAKTIDRDTASREKRMIRKALNDEISTTDYQRGLAFHQAEVARLTESAKVACRKDPTPENALQLIRVLDGLNPPPEKT